MARNADDLRRARKAAADTMQTTADHLSTLEGTAGTDAAALAAATEAFEQAQAEFTALDAQVKRAEAVEAAQAAAAVPATHAVGGAGAVTGSVPAVATDPAMMGVGVALMAMALANCRGDTERAAQRLDADGHSGLSANMGAATGSAGGFIVPRPLAAELIPMLRARVVVRRAGARTIDMPAGQVRNARQATAATAGYRAEDTPIAESVPTLDTVDESFKTLSCLVPVGNSLIRKASIPAAQMVRDDIVNVMGLREDLAFIRSTGAGDSPIGIRSQLLPANWAGAAVAATAAAAETALRSAVNRVESANIMMINCGWMMTTGAKNFIASLRDANGNYVFPTMQSATPELMGYPVYTTSQIPNNLGAGTNETEVYFGSFDYALIGDSMQMSLAVSSEAAYVTGGVTHSAFQRDLTLFRAISEHDFALTQSVAFAGFNGINWNI